MTFESGEIYYVTARVAENGSLGAIELLDEHDEGIRIKERKRIVDEIKAINQEELLSVIKRNTEASWQTNNIIEAITKYTNEIYNQILGNF